MIPTQVSARLSAADRNSVMTGINDIRQRLPFLIDLSTDDRKTIAKLGNKGLSFVKKAVEIAAQNPQILPATFDFEERSRCAEWFVWRRTPSKAKFFLVYREVADPQVADPHFYYYVFSSNEQQDYIRQHAIQTGVPHTNLGFLRQAPVPFPPLREQRAIAHILGTLDDKIELNRRMNETLEAIARTLFISWFVDFDPVRAQGRRPRPRPA
jgi:hypothetical protein